MYYSKSTVCLLLKTQSMSGETKLYQNYIYTTAYSSVSLPVQVWVGVIAAIASYTQEFKVNWSLPTIPLFTE